MSERYSRLFTLPENLYAVGSPVVIAAGTLLKDTQTGRIVAQLKLRNISDKAIKAVKVRLSLFDTAGNPIGNSVEYEYLDLSATRNLEFGQKNPVFISESKARSYEAAVVEVVFTDRTTWTESGAEWEPLPKQKTLNMVLLNAELIKQYKITVCGDVSYYPMEEKDLWYCTCGALNHKDEHCHVCRRTLFELQTIDLTRLAKDRDARLVEEFADEKARIAEKAAADAIKKKKAKRLKIMISAVCVLVAIILLITNLIIPSNKYNDAIALMTANKYHEAIATFEDLDGYKDSVQKIKDCRLAILENKYNDAVTLMDAGKFDEAISSFEEIADFKDSTNRIGEMRYSQAEELLEQGEKIQAAIMFGRAVGYEDAWERSSALWNEFTVRKTLATNWSHTVGLKSNGTVVAVGWNYYGACNVSNWTDIIAVSAGSSHTVGLKSDGTVVAVGDNNDGQCDVHDWTDIVAISADGWHTVGLKADGTVVAVGTNEDRQCDVGNWTDIIAVSAGGSHTLGLKADGTVVAVGTGLAGQDIVAVSAGYDHSVGLKSDGTVVASGYNGNGVCDVSNWTDIIAVSAGSSHTVGLKSDGTVVAVGDNNYGQCDVSGWKDIVAICADGTHTLGLKSDGNVVAVGIGLEGQCDVSGWNLFISENKETQISSKYCIVCKENAQYSYTNPFSGVAEPYCYTHYREIKDTMRMMEEDVKNSYSGSSARHTDSEAFSCATAIVKSVLKSPSTAKFCWITDATITHLGNGEYKVTGWVEAQNSFGATLRQNFVVVYTATENGYKNGTATLY